MSKKELGIFLSILLAFSLIGNAFSLLERSQRKKQVDVEFPMEHDFQTIRKYSIAGSDGKLYVVSRDWCFFTEEEALEFIGDNEEAELKEESE